MFRSCLISINENMLFSLYNNIVDNHFLKSLIKFFEKYDISSYVLNQIENEEERTKFFNNSLFELNDNDLTQEELNIINNIFKMIYFSIKDDFIIDMK